MHYRRICFFILLFGFIGASTVYSWDKEFFENIEQPIAFPHKLHVVNNGISCEYCHSSARNSVNAGIPPVRTCIGCHSLVKGRSEEQKNTGAYLLIKLIYEKSKKLRIIGRKKSLFLGRKYTTYQILFIFPIKDTFKQDLLRIVTEMFPLPKPLYGKTPCVSHLDDHPFVEQKMVILTSALFDM